VRDRARADLISAAIGPMGAVVVVAVTDDVIAKAGGVAITDRGWTLRVLDERVSMELLDPSGAVVGQGTLGELGTDGVLRNGPEGSVVAFKDGAEVARFPGQSIKQAFVTSGPATPRYRVLSSVDGHVWADEALDGLLGADPASVTRVLVSGQRAVLAAQLAPTAAGVPSKQLALVGGLKR
jgi:hypothetical protein